MTKNELIKKVRVKCKIYPQRDIALAVQAILDAIVVALKKNDRIEIRGFGVFTVRERKSRMARNPKSGARVALKDRRVAFFKTGKDLRLRVDNRR
ncbi:MAG: integration host factor subunit beta [Smithella sp.]|nr:integration host factor subunit beta [Smithella sp.]